MKIGYARVSTAEQSLDTQLDALKKAGCEQLITEKISTRAIERPKLHEALTWLRKGDTLVCTRMDRLARSIKELITILQDLNERDVGAIFLDQNIDTGSAGGRLILHVFAAVAEFERDLISERTISGLRAARARGRNGGRKRLLSGGKVKVLYEMYDSKKFPVSDICETLGVKRRTVYDYLKRRNDSASQMLS